MASVPFDDKKNRRTLRGWIIYPPLQLPLIGINVLVLGISLLVMWVASQKALNDLHPAAALSGMEVEFFRKYLKYQATQIHIMFAVAGILTLLSSTLVTVYLTHRMAGPMVALRHYFRKIKDGVQPMPRLHFRDHDFMMDIPPLVNDAIEALCQRLSERKRDSA